MPDLEFSINIGTNTAINTGSVHLTFLLWCLQPTDDEDEEDATRHVAQVPGRALQLLNHVGSAVGVVMRMIVSHAVLPNLLVHVRRQLHLHLAGVALHVLGQVEARVGVRLTVKLVNDKKRRGRE